ncbi:BPI fold-containing family B member 1 [Suncus etruscus]|uniref:BPI fold-containing family B member 1 n=1 Tax=Suncus etruscus TaxID=109475 RepID=UPI0021101F53|nr:BPI fold-containing family B member 1 [Suncus etruscus]
MARPWILTLLSVLLAASLAGAHLSPPAAFSLSPEVIKERFTQELKDHNAVNILKQLPLLNAMQEEPAGGIPLIGSLVNSILKYIVWLKVTSASILQLQVLPSKSSQEFVVRVPLDMVAGFNTPLVKTIVEMHMESEVQATIGVETVKGQSRLVLRDCGSSQGSLRISLLKSFSFMVNTLGNKIIGLLVPALPKLVKSELCPVMKASFEDLRTDLLGLVKAPVSLGSEYLEFHLLSTAIEEKTIQLHLGAKLLDSQKKVTKWFNESMASLTMPMLNGAPFCFAVRQDVVNAVIAAMLPPEELMVLLDYVLPELSHKLKESIKVISEKAAEQMGATKIVKVLLQEPPTFFLEQGHAKVAQMVVLEVFATNEVRRPFFTLGIEANSDVQFYTEGDQLITNLAEISSDRIHLMNSGIGLFNPELLKPIITELLDAILLPNENGKLRTGIPLSLVKALGFKAASVALTKDSLIITPSSS